jgi:putative RNA 2'-phosphotransferase
MDTMEISKNISYYLRHKPEEINIILDENGYVDLDLFLINMSKKMNLNIDEKVLNNILNKSDKKRFEINN